MIREIFGLIRQKTQDHEHERSKNAFLVFLALWMLCMLTFIVSHSLIASLQTLLVLHHCVSIGGALVTRVLTAKAIDENRANTYPFCFGFYRTRSVVCLAGAIFVAFGCLTTTVEAIHGATHVHYHDRKMLVVTALLHALGLLQFRKEVLSLDRISGRPFNRNGASPDEERLFKLSTTLPLQLQGCVLGGGQNLQFGGRTTSAAATTTSTTREKNALPLSPGANMRSGGYGKESALLSLFSSARLFLIPVACLATAVLNYTFHNALPDTILSLAVAIYYFSVALNQGQQLAWGIVNNAVRDPIRLNAIDRVLRAVQLLDGVLQVHSSAYFMLNPCEMVGVVRLRLMSGADAASVSASSRRLLSEVVKYPYVECFFPNALASEDALSKGFGPHLRFHVEVEHHCEHSHDEHGHTHAHNGNCNGHDLDDQREGESPTTRADDAPGATAHMPAVFSSFYPMGVTLAPGGGPSQPSFPARPSWDATPGSTTSNLGASAPMGVAYRTPLVPLQVPRPMVMPSGASPPLRSFPARPFEHGDRDKVELVNTTQRVFPAPPPSGQGNTESDGSAEFRPAAAASPSPFPSAPAATSAATGLYATPARVSATGLNVPPSSALRPRTVFTPFTSSPRTDKDV